MGATGKRWEFSLIPVLALAIGLGAEHFGFEAPDGYGWLYVLGGVLALFLVLILVVAITAWREEKERRRK